MNRYGYNLKSTMMLAAMTAQSTAVRMSADDRSDVLAADDVAMVDCARSVVASAESTARSTPQGNRAQRRAQMRRR